MRYSTEPKFRKYATKRFGFLLFARKFGDKYGKKLIDTATKTGIDASKTTSKRVGQKLQKQQEIWLEIKQMIKPLHLVIKRKINNKESRTLRSIRKKTTVYWWPYIVLST